MKDIFATLTERRIQEAIARGDFNNLSGAGKPLKIEGLYFLPWKLRAAFIVLKNSGYLDQITDGKECLPNPLSDNLNLPSKNQSVSRQELYEKTFNHRVMMDCRRRR